MFSFIIASQVGAKAAQIIAENDAQRLALGAPTLPEQTIEERKKLDKLSREGDSLMITFFILGGIIFVSPWAMFVFVIIKIAFAKQGIKWP